MTCHQIVPATCGGLRSGKAGWYHLVVYVEVYCLVSSTTMISVLLLTSPALYLAGFLNPNSCSTVLYFAPPYPNTFVPCSSASSVVLSLAIPANNLPCECLIRSKVPHNKHEGTLSVHCWMQKLPTVALLNSKARLKTNSLPPALSANALKMTHLNDGISRSHAPSIRFALACWSLGWTLVPKPALEIWRQP